jgi:hypothetical protein
MKPHEAKGGSMGHTKTPAELAAREQAMRVMGRDRHEEPDLDSPSFRSALRKMGVKIAQSGRSPARRRQYLKDRDPMKFPMIAYSWALEDYPKFAEHWGRWTERLLLLFPDGHWDMSSDDLRRLWEETREETA